MRQRQQPTQPRKASYLQGLQALGVLIDGPCTDGPKWVTYSREQVKTMADTLKQLVEIEQARIHDQAQTRELREQLRREVDLAEASNPGHQHVAVSISTGNLDRLLNTIARPGNRGPRG